MLWRKGDDRYFRRLSGMLAQRSDAAVSGLVIEGIKVIGMILR